MLQVPFVMPERVYEVTKVCEKHGMRLGCLSLSTDKEGHELLDGNLPCVAFYHMNQRQHVGLRNARICVSGWEFHCPADKSATENIWWRLSDHSDFDGLIEYVKRSEAKQVITDNYRSNGDALAKEINKRLGVSAVAMPRS